MLYGGKKSFPNFYKPQTRFVVAKTDSSSELVQASYCGSQNGVSELLQASYTLGGSQNGFSEHPQASNTLHFSQNRLSELLQASYTVKTDSPNFYTPRFEEVKTDSQDLYKPSTRFAVV